MLYSVKYKHRFSPFWKTIDRIEGQELLDVAGMMFFYKEDHTAIGISLHNTIIKYSKERFDAIKHKMEIEAGQPIITK